MLLSSVNDDAGATPSITELPLLALGIRPGEGALAPPAGEMGELEPDPEADVVDGDEVLPRPFLPFLSPGLLPPAGGKVCAIFMFLSAPGELMEEGFPGSDSKESRMFESPYRLLARGETPAGDSGEAPSPLIMPLSAFSAFFATTGDFAGDPNDPELGDGLLDLLPDCRSLRRGLGLPGLPGSLFLFPPPL